MTETAEQIEMPLTETEVRRAELVDALRVGHGKLVDQCMVIIGFSPFAKKEWLDEFGLTRGDLDQMTKCADCGEVADYIENKKGGAI